MPSGNETNGAEDFQHGDLGLDGGRGETLPDDFDGVGMREDVGSAVRVVHQGLNAADGRVVDGRHAQLRTHRRQQVEETVQTLERGEGGKGGRHKH